MVWRGNKINEWFLKTMKEVEESTGCPKAKDYVPFTEYYMEVLVFEMVFSLSCWWWPCYRARQDGTFEKFVINSSIISTEGPLYGKGSSRKLTQDSHPLRHCCFTLSTTTTGVYAEDSSLLQFTCFYVRDLGISL